MNLSFALKVALSSDETVYTSSSDEARLLKRLKCQYIIEYEDFFSDSLNFFIVTEFCAVKKISNFN